MEKSAIEKQSTPIFVDFKPNASYHRRMMSDDEIKEAFRPAFEDLARRSRRGEDLEVVYSPDGEFSVEERYSEEGYVVYIPDHFEIYADYLGRRGGMERAFEEFWRIEGASIIQEVNAF